MASDDVIPSFASISGVDPFSLALGIRYLGEVNSVRSDRCHGGLVEKLENLHCYLFPCRLRFQQIPIPIILTSCCVGHSLKYPR